MAYKCPEIVVFSGTFRNYLAMDSVNDTELIPQTFRYNIAELFIRPIPTHDCR